MMYSLWLFANFFRTLNKFFNIYLVEINRFRNSFWLIPSHTNDIVWRGWRSCFMGGVAFLLELSHFSRFLLHYNTHSTFHRQVTNCIKKLFIISMSRVVTSKQTNGDCCLLISVVVPYSMRNTHFWTFPIERRWFSIAVWEQKQILFT